MLEGVQAPSRQVELLAERVDAYVVETVRNDLTFRSWVTEDGEVVKQTSPVGLVFIREPENVTRAFKGLALEGKHRYPLVDSRPPLP